MTNPFKKINMPLVVWFGLVAVFALMVLYEVNLVRGLYVQLNQNNINQKNIHITRLNFGEYQKAISRYQDALNYPGSNDFIADPFSNPVKVDQSSK